MKTALFAVLFTTATLGCRPEFEDRTSAVKRLRVLAVQSEPPEVVTGAAVHYRALVVDDKGTRTDLGLDWAFCTRPKPLAELADVSILCFRSEADWIEKIGLTGEVDATVPNNACRQFGSDVPEPKPGDPPGRPADPDGTGGYYQPLRLLVTGPETAGGVPVLGLGQTRLVCGLPGATREVLEKFRADYRPNVNPGIASVAKVDGATSTPLAAEADPPTLVVAPGSITRLRTTWPGCVAGQKDCKGAEQFLYFDLVSGVLRDRRESMRVSWYTNAGSFAEERTGRDEGDPLTYAENDWTAPTAPGTYKIWVVLRDSRNGVDFRALRLDVK